MGNEYLPQLAYDNVYYNDSEMGWLDKTNCRVCNKVITVEQFNVNFGWCNACLNIANMKANKAKDNIQQKENLKHIINEINTLH